MPPDLLITAIGAGAAACSMASFVPQAAKIIRERDAASVTLRMYAVTVVGFALWIAYGASLKSWPLAGSSTVCFALSGLILALEVKDLSTGKTRRPPESSV